MKLIVTTPKGEEKFDGTYDYETNDGELDVIVADIVVKTYAKDAWLTVSREKADDEDWPEPVKQRVEREGGDGREPFISLNVDDDEEDEIAAQIALPTLNLGEPLSKRIQSIMDEPE